MDHSTALCFTGHRHLSGEDQERIIPALRDLLEDVWFRGYRSFLCGGALGFDTLAAREVLCFRESHPEARLVMVVPCASQADHWAARDRAVYRDLLARADETRVLSDFYYAGCMQTRNRFLVDHSSLCVCFLSRLQGGTWSTVRYALQQNLPVINLAMPAVHSPVFREMFSPEAWREG